MSFMKDEAPLYVDKYWCVQRLIDAWNEKMNETFQPGWIIGALQGQLDGVPFHVFCMKEEDYVSMLMSTYGTQEQMGNEQYDKLMDGSIRRFKYPEVLHNHFRY